MAEEQKDKGRKHHWLMVSYNYTLGLALVYIGVMYLLKSPPDPLVITGAFGVLGVSHGTANIANGNEHKSKAGQGY